MAKSPADRGGSRPATKSAAKATAKPAADAAPATAPGGYFHWSRDAAVGLFAVLPLWLVYE